MSTYAYVDPAGRRLTIKGKFKRRLLLWQSQFAVTSPLNGRVPDSLRTRTLTVSQPQNHDGWLADTAKATLVGEYSISGGLLQIWRPSDETRQGLGRWVGKFHAATAYLPFHLWEDHGFVLGYFAGLQFEDSETGLAARPAKSSIKVSVLDVTAFIEGTGLLEILSPDVGLGSVPVWRGLAARGGEIWKVTGAEDPEVTDHLIMSNGSAVATVTPDARATLDDCLEFLGDITLLNYQGASQ